MASTEPSDDGTRADDRIDTVRRLYDAWNSRDFDAAAGLLAPDVEVDRTASMGPDAVTFRGLDEVMAFVRRWLDTWEEAEWTGMEYSLQGEDVIALGLFRGRGLASGAAVEANVTQVFTIRDGKVVRSRLFQSAAEALGAAGGASP
jgi:ketosteroid isomerase-like protein